MSWSLRLPCNGNQALILILTPWSQTSHSCFPLFNVDSLEIANCSNLTTVFYPLSNFRQTLCIRSCHEDMILRRKNHNCTGIAFIQGDSASNSKLIEQTLHLHLYFMAYESIQDLMRPKFLGHYFSFKQVFGINPHQVLVVHELIGYHQDLGRWTLDPTLHEAIILEAGSSSKTLVIYWKEGFCL